MTLRATATRLALLGTILLVAPAAADWTTEGRVAALDGERPTITLDHGPVGELLPAARTEFPVARRELLRGVSLGDAVRVTLAADGDAHGVLAVTGLEPSSGPGRAGARDGALILPAAIAAAALLGLLALWLETRRLRRSLVATSQALLYATRRHATDQRKLGADLEATAGALREIARALAGQLASATERVRLARAGPTAEPARAGDGLPLFVVRAGDVDTYRMLAERLARPGLARVAWDRRRRDRRTAESRVSPDRRRRERRGAPPPTWETLGYVAVPPAPDRRLTSVA